MNAVQENRVEWKVSSPSRRDFLRSSSLALSTLSLGAFATAAPHHRKPSKIVLRSSWQTVNIGDIGHTPGVLRLLSEHLPEVEVRLWPSNVGNGVEAMLQRRFPQLEIVRNAKDQQRALQECDFLLHGSGPSLVAEKDVERWINETGKPFGVYGITLPTPIPNQPASVGNTSQKTIDILSQATFAYFRDSVSLSVAETRGCKCPVMEFGPDGAFAVDVRNDELADTFLRANKLETGKFLCCIPRYRYTPYWLIHPERKKDETKEARNIEMKEQDHAPLREAIRLVLRDTDLKILLCPEDQSQMAIGKEMILDRLPEEARKRVVWRDRYWLTDEALSIYSKSAGLFGNEMHSPIMCVGNGIPAIVCRFAEQTSKGIMWKDIGLADWLFDLDREEEVARIPSAVLELATNLDRARAKIEPARAFVRERQRVTMANLASVLAR